MIGAPADDLVFTSSGTEANNLAVKGVAEAARTRHAPDSFNIEHPSIDQSVAGSSNRVPATRVPVDREGRCPRSRDEAITEQTILIATHHANHDLGTVQDLAALSALAGKRGIPLLIDATASGGWLPVDIAAIPISLLSLAPHRFGGPQGVGVLYRNPRVPLAPQVHGGVQQGGLRAGTENLAAIIGAGAAAALPAIEMGPLQQQLHAGLLARIEQISLNGPTLGVDRLPTQLNYSLAGLEGEGLALALDMQGVAIASGAACVTQNLAIPPALAAIGLDAAQAKGNVLFSLGRDTIAADIDHVLEIIPKQVDKLRSLSPTWDA